MSSSLRDVAWDRFLRAPDGQLVAKLYEPGLRRAVRYDRCCAYFSSSVLSAAASGFGAFIQRVLDGSIAKKPAIRLLVNEELSVQDVRALLDAGDDAPLIQTLLERFGSPTTALQKRRLEMLAWLAREGWLEVKVGIMRQAEGILHAKFGLFTDANSDAVIFAGSGNESAKGVRGNYEKLEISTSWADDERHQHYSAEFEALWDGDDPAVATVTLPDAVRDALIKLAPEAPPTNDSVDNKRRQRAAMLWEYALSAPWFAMGGEDTCDAMAPVTMWPHQHKVVAETTAAWPEGRLLCDEVGMGKTVEAILVLRRLLAGRGVKRALLLPPANLLPQWQGELREKGGLRVPRLEGPRTLVWEDGRKETVDGLTSALKQDVLLLSRETARTESNVPVLMAAQPWDLVLLDEGHAARRASQVETEFNAPTLLLGLLRQLQLTGQARSFMILSATPMQTHPWEPWDLLQVLGEGGLWLSGFHVVRTYYEAVSRLQRGRLTSEDASAVARILSATRDIPDCPSDLKLPPVCDEGRFAHALRFLPGADRDKVASWLRSCSPLAKRMHRNTRRTLRRYFDMGLLPRPPAKRSVRDAPFDFATPEEREVYDAVTRYIDRRFDELEHQRPGKGFVMTIYRRRAASSPVALRKSLERRSLGLRAVVAQRAYDDSVLDLDDADELEDLLSFKLSSALPDSPQEALIELGDIEALVARIDALGALDTKRDRLVEWVRNLTRDGRSLLVFTGYSDTMEYLRENLASAFGETVASYSGAGGAIRTGRTWHAASKETVTQALNKGTIKVLVCTDAASEGLNLQAAGALINFDMPWNPSKVEQRIGRIDRIGQAHPELPIVNLFLQDSVDQRVYQALHLRCGLFENFVGPMQPVLSQALRMLIGRSRVDETALEQAAQAIRADATVMDAFPDDAASAPVKATPLLQFEDVNVLLDALDGTGIKVTPLTNSVHRLSDGPLCIVTARDAVKECLDAACVDGLDQRQWRVLQELQQPGERLPLVIASSDSGTHRAVNCVWVDRTGMKPISSFKALCELVQSWDGSEPPKLGWQAARSELILETRQQSEQMRSAALDLRRTAADAQISAARERLIDELGKTLVCFQPDTDDLNSKFHRLMSDKSATATRLQTVYWRLDGYPNWRPGDLSSFREHRALLSANQVKTRLTGRELDAALADPRWSCSISATIR